MKRYRPSEVFWVANGRRLALRQPLMLKPTRTGSSYEGVGLSVSRCPAEWSVIARLSGPTYTLRRADAKAGSFLVWSQALSEAASAWAVKEGWAQDGEMWRVFYEDEDGDERFMDFDLREDAEDEAEAMDEGRVERAAVIMATQRLADRWAQWFRGTGSRLDPVLAAVEVTNLYVAMAHPSADGIWWNEELDVAAFSAPRGVILPHALPLWQAMSSDAR